VNHTHDEIVSRVERLLDCGLPHQANEEGNRMFAEMFLAEGQMSTMRGNANPETIHSPLAIEILMWHHTRMDAYSWPSEATAQPQEIERLKRLGALRETSFPDGMRLTITPLGTAWVKAICNTPIPREAFIDGHGRVIE
jgi:hypothetical protein